MIPNKEDFAEWCSNPCTVVFLDAVKQAKESAQESPRIRETIDLTVLNNAKQEGYIVGMDDVLTIVDDLKRGV
jgi:hypothetical protein